MSNGLARSFRLVRPVELCKLVLNTAAEIQSCIWDRPAKHLNLGLSTKEVLYEILRKCSALFLLGMLAREISRLR
jgi:hypothetical protein